MGDFLDNLIKDFQKQCKSVDDFNKGILKNIDNTNKDLLPTLGKTNDEIMLNFGKLIKAIEMPLGTFTPQNRVPKSYNPYSD